MTVTLSAQPQEEMKGRFGRPMERLDRYKKIRMVEVLNLDEETGVKLVSRYTKHRERMKEIESDRADLVEKLETMTQSGTSEAEYQRVFNEIYEIEKKISEARKKFLDELKEFLTSKQIAQYMVFERDFMKDVRNVVKDVQKERLRRD
jgi:Spy/CpxP family protein refolding chaperone